MSTTDWAAVYGPDWEERIWDGRGLATNDAIAAGVERETEHEWEATPAEPDPENHHVVMGDADQYEEQWEAQKERVAELEAEDELEAGG